MDMYGFQWDRSLVFIDNVTEGRSSLMNCEVHRELLSAHIKQKCSKVDWIVLSSADGQ